MRTYITALLAACALSCTAAELRLRGEVTDHVTRQPLGDVLVRVYRNGVKEHSFNTGVAGKYNINLKRGGEYVIRFSLPGHVTKCYAVDTRGASWEGDTREVAVDVEMTMFEKIDGLDLSFFDLPMGMARFCPMTGMLKWDKAYEERISAEVGRLMAEVRSRREAAQNVSSVLEN